MTSNSLIDFSTENFIPKPDQQKAMIALNAFFLSDCKVFILRGYAGTGKTTLTKLLARYIGSTYCKPVLMAPTGRAARIMSEKTGYPATTIHKAIYDMQLLDEIEIKTDEKVQYKFRYGLKQPEETITNVYLVDEASMISDKYSEDDFFVFGSGIILKDLLNHIAPSNLVRKDKLIFIGDDAQLPPVTDAVSGALDGTYLLANYAISVQEYQLTEVIRQSEESGILENATRLRKLIKLPGRHKPFFNTSYPDVREIKASQMLQEFRVINPGLSTTGGILLVARNKTAYNHNIAIRELYFPGKQHVQAGETLLINQNNYNHPVELLNGMLVKVLAADDVTETKSHMMSYDANGKECFVTHRYRWVTIEVPTDDGKKMQIRCMILDSFLFSPENALNYAENIALYIDFKIRHPNLTPKTPAFTQALKNDPYFNSLKVKFGYAVTVHKAQGGEWEKVMADMDYYQSYTSKSFLRWAYTAITRAARQLILFNIPSSSLFNKLDFRNDRLADPAIPVVKTGQPAEKIILVLPLNYTEQINNWFKEDASFLIEKYHTVLAQLQDTGILITDRKKISFAEEYIFAIDNKQAIVTFYYNGKNQFTRVLPSAGKPQNPQLLQQLLTITGKAVDFVLPGETHTMLTTVEMLNEAEETDDFIFPEKQQQFKPLFSGLKELLPGKEITIQNIEHKEYVERYFFARGAEKAMVQFWYDGLDQFTVAIPHLPNCNSNKLLDDIAGVVKEIQEAM